MSSSSSSTSRRRQADQEVGKSSRNNSKASVRKKQAKKQSGGKDKDIDSLRKKETSHAATFTTTEKKKEDKTRATKHLLCWSFACFLLAIVLILFFWAQGASWLLPFGEKRSQVDTATLETSHAADSEDYSDFCTLYAAPSSVRGDAAGLGVYAGINFSKNEVLTKLPDAALLVEAASSVREHGELSWVWQSYAWSGGSNAGFPHYWAHLVWLAGFGMLANSHTGLDNIHQVSYEMPNVPHRHLSLDASPLQTYQQPSPQLWRVTRNISAGEELFVHYGDRYFRLLEEDLGDDVLFPFAKHYDAADRYLRQFVDANKQSLERLQKEGSRDLRRALQKHWRGKLEGLRREDGEDQRRSVVALPTQVEDLLRAAEFGTASLSVVEQPRSMQWLRQHGACLDGMRPTLSSTGPGGWVQSASTTRPFAAGEVVSIVPLIPFSRNQLKGVHVLRSHCFGHVQSSLLLCPYWSHSVGAIIHNNHRDETASQREASVDNIHIIGGHSEGRLVGERTFATDCGGSRFQSHMDLDT